MSTIQTPAVATFTRYTTDESTCEPELNEHSGERVTVLRELGPDDGVDEEVGPMFEMRFADGLVRSAFADELTDWEGIA